MPNVYSAPTRTQEKSEKKLMEEFREDISRRLYNKLLLIGLHNPKDVLLALSRNFGDIILQIQLEFPEQDQKKKGVRYEKIKQVRSEAVSYVDFYVARLGTPQLQEFYKDKHEQVVEAAFEVVRQRIRKELGEGREREEGLNVE